MWWLGLIACMLLTVVCAMVSGLAFFFSGFSLYGGGTRRATDWLLPMAAAAVFFLATLVCANQISAHPLTISVGIHSR